MPATAFVLAAGFGTRLRPLTNHLPKPLVPVCGVPMLSYALALCAKHGHTDVIVNAHYLPETMLAWHGLQEGVNVTLSVEAPDILGTGGGLKLVRDHLAERIVVVNADILCDVDLTALRDAVPAGGAAMAVRPSPELDKYGIVATDADGVIVQMRKVSEPGTEPVARDTHSTGLHALDKAVLDRVPDGFACIVGDAYLDLVKERAMRGVRHEGSWLDVGDPTAYLDANLAVLDGAVPLALDPFTRAHAARPGAYWVGPDALVDGELHRSIVGLGATVPAGARLRDCVVWDGVSVPPGNWERTVFHPGGSLRA